MSESPFESWYYGLKRYKGGFPARGTIGGALAVLEQIRESKLKVVLEIKNFTADGGSQVSGASGGRLEKVLRDFGETRPFLSEGGRTNRGLRGDIRDMLAALRQQFPSGLCSADDVRIRELQHFLVDRIRDFHNQQRLKLLYDPNLSLSRNLEQFLQSGDEVGKLPALAQYLVGAKLQLRFPNLKVSNDSLTTKDEQLGRVGDFTIGDTAFHVTVSPGTRVLERCRQNINEGFRPYLIVPRDRMEGTRQLVDLDYEINGKVSLADVVSFVAQNIEELSTFSAEDIKRKVVQLFELYNRRIDEVEYDKSLKVDLPRNLLS